MKFADLNEVDRLSLDGMGERFGKERNELMALLNKYITEIEEEGKVKKKTAILRKAFERLHKEVSNGNGKKKGATFLLKVVKILKPKNRSGYANYRARNLLDASKDAQKEARENGEVRYDEKTQSFIPLVQWDKMYDGKWLKKGDDLPEVDAIQDVLAYGTQKVDHSEEGGEGLIVCRFYGDKGLKMVEELAQGVSYEGLINPNFNNPYNTNAYIHANCYTAWKEIEDDIKPLALIYDEWIMDASPKYHISLAETLDTKTKYDEFLHVKGKLVWSPNKPSFKKYEDGSGKVKKSWHLRINDSTMYARKSPDNYKFEWVTLSINDDILTDKQRQQLNIMGKGDYIHAWVSIGTEEYAYWDAEAQKQINTDAIRPKLYAYDIFINPNEVGGG